MGNRSHIETPIWVLAMLDKSLSAVEYRVLSYIFWRQGKNRSAYPSQAIIALELGLTAEGVRKIIGRLAESGWLTVERPAHTAPNRRLQYHVTGPTNHPNSGLGERPNSGLGVVGGNHPNGQAEITPTAKPRHNRRTHTRTQTEEGGPLSPGDTSTPAPPSDTESRKPKPKAKTRPRKIVQAVEYTLDFDRFWTAYPRKVKKVAAFEVWTILAPGPELIEKIIRSVLAHCESQQWAQSLAEDGGQYIPYPTTFLNQTRWEDSPPAKREPQRGDGLNLDGSSEDEIRAAFGKGSE